jgi:hypothetical protein
MACVNFMGGIVLFAIKNYLQGKQKSDNLKNNLICTCIYIYMYYLNVVVDLWIIIIGKQ